MESTRIVEKSALLSKIVGCITKAVGEDINAYLQEHRLETNNNLLMLRGDCINQNLRKLIADGNLILIPFKRFAWEGRILLDKLSKITYTILSFSALEAVRKNKIRNWPHYLHSILNEENAGLEAVTKQMCLEKSGDFGPVEFDKEDLHQDYTEILGEYLELALQCRHYVVAYTQEHGQVQNIELLLLDKNLDVVDSLSLNKYIVPDFADLTVTDHGESTDVEENVRNFVNIKPGLEPKFRENEKQG